MEGAMDHEFGILLGISLIMCAAGVVIQGTTIALQPAIGLIATLAMPTLVPLALSRWRAG